MILIDEAFAPLDPSSKLLVQEKLKEFCSSSLILVIYHTGTGCMRTDSLTDVSPQVMAWIVLVETTSLTTTCTSRMARPAWLAFAEIFEAHEGKELAST